ncbi:MAG TPA: hypothetical protein VJT73_10645, partial [Polyangiaceae bacterium]|nr:hypothetical protein [Polyangiaceae bacterium]
IVVDDDEAWHRSMRRALRELGVRRVYCMNAGDDAEQILGEFDRCVVLTELKLGAHRLGGLSVVQAAERIGAPAAVVTEAPPPEWHKLAAVPLLSKADVNPFTLRALLRDLEREL